jgi:natural product precursor
MKKISLKALKEGLTRDEMRALKGGGCGNGPGGSCIVNHMVFNCRVPYICYSPTGSGFGTCRTPW